METQCWKGGFESKLLLCAEIQINGFLGNWFSIEMFLLIGQFPNFRSGPDFYFLDPGTTRMSGDILSCLMIFYLPSLFFWEGG